MDAMCAAACMPCLRPSPAAAPLQPQHVPAALLLPALSCQVTKDTIVLKNGEQLPYGVCVWSAGNAPRPLVQQLAGQIPEQARRCL